MRSNWPFDEGVFRGVGWVGDRDSIGGVSLVDKVVVKRYQGLYISSRRLQAGLIVGR